MYAGWRYKIKDNFSRLDIPQGINTRGVTIQFAHDTIRISIQQPRYDSYLDSRYGGSKLSNMFWWTSGVLYSIVVMINELTELENRVTDYNSTTSETLKYMTI